MSSFPSAALQYSEQNNPANQVGNIVRLKGLMQQSQIGEQQIQENDLALQEKRKAIKDQETLTKAYMDAKGDLNITADLAAKAGIDPQIVMKIKAADLQQRQSLATLTKEQADALKAQTGLIGQHSQALLSLPPEERPAGLQQSITSLVQAGAVKPEQAQQLMQSAPVNDPKALETWLKVHATSAMSTSEQLDQIEKAKLAAHNAKMYPAQEATAQAEASIKGAEAQAVKEGGVAPGIPLENQAATAWLKKNPGKGLDDFVAWKAKQSPAALTLNNMLGQGGQGSALDQAAERYSQSGELPAGFSRSPGTTTAIIKRAAELHPEANIAGNKAIYASNKKALGELQTQFSKVESFENTAIANIDLALASGKQIPDLGARFANVPIRMLSDKMLGTPAMAKFKADLYTAQTESAKVLSSATGSGVLSDSARKELQDIVSGNLPYPAMVEAFNEIKADMGNRHVAYQNEITHLQGMVGGTSQPNGKPAVATDPFAQFGGKPRQ